MGAPRPPARATAIEIAGYRDPYRLVHAIVRRLGAPVGPDLGVADDLPIEDGASETAPSYRERVVRRRWSLGAFAVESVEWTLYDPNDRWDSGGTSELAWTIDGLAGARRMHLQWTNAGVTVHVSPDASDGTTELVRAAAAETARA